MKRKTELTSQLEHAGRTAYGRGDVAPEFPAVLLPRWSVGARGDVMRANGDTVRAKALKDEMDRFGGQREWAYREPADRIAVGKAAIRLGADPKRVTELFFDPVKKANLELADAYLANGELALAKHDFALAAVPPGEKTVVEIFPDQKDFAIRTFGLPGGAGYLGVCFGRVITANSPASRPGSPQNWQAVLWHEFTHVVTLTLTKNKMPRWLSEGISVNEERQQRANWGEHMTPRYRAMILGADLTPVSKLSGAFLRPKTGAHLQFAYSESSLVVEWLVKKWGVEKMRALLADLARGVEINAALAAHFAPIEKVDAEFSAHARGLANATGPMLDWTKPEPAVRASDAKLTAWMAARPDNFTVLTEQAKQLLAEKKWAAAKAPLL